MCTRGPFTGPRPVPKTESVRRTGFAVRSGCRGSLGRSRTGRSLSPFVVERNSRRWSPWARSFQNDDGRHEPEEQPPQLPSHPLLLGQQGYAGEKGGQYPALRRHRAKAPADPARPKPRLLTDDRRCTHSTIIAPRWRPGRMWTDCPGRAQDTIEKPRARSPEPGATALTEPGPIPSASATLKRRRQTARCYPEPPRALPQALSAPPRPA